MSNKENFNDKYKMFFQDPKILDLRDQELKQVVQMYGAKADISNDIMFAEIPHETEVVESDRSSSYENNTNVDSDSSFDVEKIKAEFNADMKNNLICYRKNDFAAKVEKWIAESRHEFSRYKITLKDKDNFYQCDKMSSVTDNKVSSYDNCSDASVDTAKYIRSNKNKKSKITMLTIKEYNFKVIENRSKSTSDMDFIKKKKMYSKDSIHSSDNFPQIPNSSQKLDSHYLKNQLLELKNYGDELSLPSVQTKLKNNIPVPQIRTPLMQELARTKLLNSNSKKKRRLKLKNKEYRKKIESRNESYIISSDSSSDSNQCKDRVKKLRRKINSIGYKEVVPSKLNSNDELLTLPETLNHKKIIANRKNKMKKKRLTNLPIIGSTLAVGDILIASNTSTTNTILITENELTNAIGIEKAKHLINENKLFQYVLPPCTELIFKPYMLDPLDDDEELFANIVNRGYLKKKSLK